MKESHAWKKSALSALAQWDRVGQFLSKHKNCRIGESASDAALRLLKERDTFEELVSKAAEAMGFIRWAAILWGLNGPTWSEEAGFGQKMTIAIMKREHLITKLKKALESRLHAVDDYYPRHYVGCEGQPCVCDSCAEIKQLLKLE